MITEKEIDDARNKAYLEAGENAYFGSGFNAGVRFAISQIKIMLSTDDLDEMKRMAHQGLPDDCVRGWDEVKFCDARNGDGGECKRCSHYR